MTWLQTIFKLRRKPVDQEEEEKPFLEHLEDLRWTLIKMAIALALCMMASFVFVKPISDVIEGPRRTTSKYMAENYPDYRDTPLNSLNPVDNISVTFKVSFYAGLVLSFPLQLYYLAAFLLPGLTARERGMLLPVLLLGTGLFVAGVLFSYGWVLPGTLIFFAEDQRKFGWNSQWSVTEYYGFVTQFSIGFGLAFELPLVVILLVKLGVIDFKMMHATRAYAFIILLTLAAIITPTTDVFSLMAMAVPLVLLYEICIWISYFMGRKKAAEASGEAGR
jgi:sec-independent protein translocase protein TatC